MITHEGLQATAADWYTYGFLVGIAGLTLEDDDVLFEVTYQSNLNAYWDGLDDAEYWNWLDDDDE
jgi:hypothetical protein